MNEILRAKVRCCPEFKTALIQSAEKELVEAVRSDRFWSCGLSPRDATLTKSSFYPGENNLGRILEDIKDSLTPDLEILEKELTENKNDDYDDSEQTHQTDTACSWLVCHSATVGGTVRGNTVQIVSTYPASPEARPPSFLGKPAVRPRSMAGGAPTPCGRH